MHRAETVEEGLDLQDLRKRVTLAYKEHIGVPTACFADTRHFVSDVRTIEGPAPLSPAPQQ
jgi:hypothetical protein